MNWWTCGWWDFPAQSVCKKIRYCCFSHSALVAADGRRIGSWDPIVSPWACGFPSACSLRCSVFLFEPCHPMVECERVYSMCSRLPACLHISTYEYVRSRFFGRDFFFSFFDLCRINCGSHMCVETVWGRAVSCPLTFDFLLPFLIHLCSSLFHSPTAALVTYTGPALFIQLKMSD